MRKLLALCLFIAAAASAQVPTQIPITGAFGTNGDFCLLGCYNLVLVADANYTPTIPERANRVIIVTSSVSLTATRNIILPNINPDHVIINKTTGGQAIQIIGASGTGTTIANGATALVDFDGTNYVTVGGGGTPGGSTGQVQFNNGGIFGGKALVGAGTGGIPTVPATPIVPGNVVVADASGGMADSGRAPVPIGSANNFFESNGTSISPVTMSGGATLGPGGVVILTGITNAAPTTGVACTTSGTYGYSNPISLTGDNKVIVNLAACVNSTSTSQTITFPVAFVNTPAIIYNSSGLSVTATTTTLTLTTSNNSTAHTGAIVLENY